MHLYRLTGLRFCHICMYVMSYIYLITAGSCVDLVVRYVLYAGRHDNQSLHLYLVSLDFQCQTDVRRNL